MLVGATKTYRHHLDVSPDGHRLAFVESSRYLQGVVRIWDVRTGSMRTIPLTTQGIVTAAAWTPGGTGIAFLVTFPAPVGRYPPSSLYTVRTDGTEPNFC